MLHNIVHDKKPHFFFQL